MKQQDRYYPCALTIAGSDSGGGAGIQADLRTFSAVGVYGCSVITAVTSQNPRRVSRIDTLPAAAVAAQLEAVFECFAVAAMKTGMLANAEIIEAVAGFLKKLPGNIPLVVDPVMVSTSGARLLEEDAVAAMTGRLLPLARWITPNLPEAELLLERKLPDFESRVRAAREISRRWSCSCFLKTGHDVEGRSEAGDIICHQDRVLVVSTPVVEGSRASHGTGCTLSSAIAGLLAAGNSWMDTVCEAKAFVYGSLLEAAEVGPGCEAMYPPLENYRPIVSVNEIKGS